MSKAKELVALSNFAASLGKESYTGGWLLEQLPYIEAAIRSDVPVGCRAMTLAEMQLHVDRLIVEAEAKTDKMIDAAIKESTDIIEKARQFSARTKEDAKIKLRNLADSI